MTATSSELLLAQNTC